MEEHLPPLDGLVQIASYWTLNPDYSFSAWSLRADGKKNEYNVSKDQLRTLHEDLPEALQAIIVSRLTKGEQGIAQQFKVQATLQLLQFGGIAFKDMLGVSHLLSKVSELYSISTSANLVGVSGTAVDVEHVQHKGRKIGFVVNIKHPVLTVERMELEHRYPGWEKRLAVGRELEIDEPSLFRHVFMNAAVDTTPPAINAITFE